jgi:hypothetical protein
MAYMIEGVDMQQTGRTKSMVMSLPDTGACVIVHSGSMRRYIERMMFDLRGRDFLKRCKVLVIYGHSDLHRLNGLSLPTFVDHAFEYCSDASLSAQAQMMAIVDRINYAFTHKIDENKSINI